MPLKLVTLPYPPRPFLRFEHDLMPQKGTIDDGDSGKDVIIIRNSQV
jgi:hypothetical protein